MTRFRIAAAAMVVAAGLFVGLAPADDAAPRLPTYTVERHTDLAYRTGPDADPERHKLDLYVPKGKKNYPVLFFVHGGSWKSGSKSLYIALGEAFARLGIGTVVTNYRLSPQVKHPVHAEDVARSFAWVRANVGQYGGDADNITLLGHSAGGHLVSLLATDPAYLKAEKLTPDAIRGVIAVSGVYEIRHDVPLFHPVFGKDAAACKAASPLTHVSGKHPPFLIAYADKDLATLDAMAVDMNAALKKCQCRTTLLKLTGKNHFTIITGTIDEDDRLHQAIRAFVLGK